MLPLPLQPLRSCPAGRARYARGSHFPPQLARAPAGDPASWRVTASPGPPDGRNQILCLPRAFSLLLGFVKRACSGVFIGENAHRTHVPGLHPQGKCSSGRLGCGRWRR
jgi:hypothetical protein